MLSALKTELPSALISLKIRSKTRTSIMNPGWVLSLFQCGCKMFSLFLGRARLYVCLPALEMGGRVEGASAIARKGDGGETVVKRSLGGLERQGWLQVQVQLPMI